VEAKIFEVLAPGTKSAAMGVKLSPLGAADNGIAGAAGFGEGRILVATLKSQPNYITYDKFNWLHGSGGISERNGMMFLVHEEIEGRWDELTSGDTIDVTSRWDEVADKLARPYAAEEG